MDEIHAHNNGLPIPFHTDVSGVGSVLTAPKANRDQSLGRKRKWCRQDSDSDKRKSTKEVKRRGRESFRSSVRRSSPVADRRTTSRQRLIRSSWLRPKTRSTQGSLSRSRASEDTPRRRHPPRTEKQSRNRSDSPELFVSQDDTGDEADDNKDDDTDNASEYYGPGEEGIGDYQLDSDDGDSGCDLPTKVEGASTCQCPINLRCPVRSDHLIDCRALVLEWTRWNVAVQVQFNAQLNQVVPPVVAAFTTAQRVNKMHEHCARVARHPLAHPSDRSDYARMVAWVAEMHIHSITQGILDATQILPLLQAFLTPPNANHHVAKRTPKNLLEEVEVLFKRWTQKDLLADVNRGIIRTVVQTAGHGPRYSERIDPQWPYRMSDVFYGHGHLVNGQRWFSRLQMSLAGAHGAPQAGICGGKKLGARSIVMGFHDERRNEYYADIDKGETIWYVGTAREKLKIESDPEPEETNIKDTAASRNRWHRSPTNATQALMKSRETGTPVRVFRSYRLAEIVPHKPKQGFRYDGLYRVVGQEHLKADRQIWRFKMRRLRRNDPASDGQGPLRGVRVQGA